METNRYVVKSLELHLFYARIMKEHALFLRAGFTPANAQEAETAEYYRKEFEDLLRHAVELSNGVVRKKVLEYGETVTEFTLLAEHQTECLTTIPIDQELTNNTLCLKGSGSRGTNAARIRCKVQNLNRTARKLLDGLIEFKEFILECVRRGAMFTGNYPLLIEHILREARLYRKYVDILEREGDLPDRVVKENECFWNQIMMEHAQFIRGLLDPCERELFCAADGYAAEYCKLLEAGKNAQDQSIRAASLAQTVKFRDFKAAGTQGIQQSKIRSVILPLLADHVLREANHYIRLLKD